MNKRFLVAAALPAAAPLAQAAPEPDKVFEKLLESAGAGAPDKMMESLVRCIAVWSKIDIY